MELQDALNKGKGSGLNYQVEKFDDKAAETEAVTAPTPALESDTSSRPAPGKVMKSAAMLKAEAASRAGNAMPVRKILPNNRANLLKIASRQRGRR